MELHLGKCEDVIIKLEDNKYQLIYFNPPFQFFEAKWDKNHLDYGFLWEHLWRVLKPNGAVIIHTSQRFTYYIINTQPKFFKYFYNWKKNNKSNFLQAKRQPLRQTEEICVFYRKQCKYNPQMTLRDKPYTAKNVGKSNLYQRLKGGITKIYTHTYPTNFIEIKGRKGIFNRPKKLCDFIIQTYTDKNDWVLDLTMGDGITGLSCKKLNRNFTGIDMTEKHFNICKNNLI
jgi:site-specific DNA-methyltransferase (adenine-specific)